jgi:hypothetical protein
MLSTDQRTLLVDLLAPPAAGYRLVHAVATTFTLHLTSLIPIPLGLAGQDLSADTDPMAVLQAIQSYSSRIDVFCQAGQVAVPAKRNDLLAFIEKTVHQVAVPSPGRLFHPKLWVLGFRADDDDERFRLVCGSRNLTADRSWDAAISLEGNRTSRPQARNRPIADLLRSLPGRTVAGIEPDRTAAIEELADGLRYVEWERPEGATGDDDWLTFHVFGKGLKPKPDLSGYRRLIISPFLNNGGLDRVWPDAAGQADIISRTEQLDAVDGDWPELPDDSDRWVLSETASIPDEDDETAGPQWSLSGLHAKVFVVERARLAHVFIGSANATDAAWGGNDEVLVEVTGRVRDLGVDATLGIRDGTTIKTGLRNLLLPYVPGSGAELGDAELIWQLEDAVRALASLTFTARGRGEPPTLRLSSVEPLALPATLPDGADLFIAPLTVPDRPYRPILGSPIDHTWALPEAEDITPFFSFRLSVGEGSARREVSTVVVARLIEDVPDRLDRLLARRIGTPEAFLQFLQLLLQFAADEASGSDGDGAGAVGWFGSMANCAGILESLVLALAKTPQVMDQIDRLATRLASTEQGRKVLPPGWDAVWAEFSSARARLAKQS